MTTSLTADIDEHFDTAFPAACEHIGCKPIDLLGVMASESGVRPYAHNQGPAGAPPEKQYNAVGLIQFMPDTLIGLGWRSGYEAFKHLSASQQLPYVVAFFVPWQKTGAPWDSAARLYQACFLPGTLATQRAADEVLVARGGRLGWAYEANASFDANGDGSITVAELGEAIARASVGARWLELLGRLGIEAPTPGPELELEAALGNPTALDALLRTPAGMQAALVHLSYNVGPYGVDGSFGRDSRAALAHFQSDAKIKVDGIPGAQTRAAMAIALHDVPRADKTGGDEAPSTKPEADTTKPSRRSRRKDP